MKVINDLLVVEVPKDYDYFMIKDSDTQLAIHRKSNNSVVTARIKELPFPCTIIGLASEIDDVEKEAVLDAYGNLTKVKISMFEQWATHAGLTTTDTTDLLFLKRLP